MSVHELKICVFICGRVDQNRRCVNHPTVFFIVQTLDHLQFYINRIEQGILAKYFLSNTINNIEHF